jgi:hypothetical protein
MSGVLAAMRKSGADDQVPGSEARLTVSAANTFSPSTASVVSDGAISAAWGAAGDTGRARSVSRVDLPPPSYGTTTPTRAPGPGACGPKMDWYILFDRGASAGLYKAETEEAALERACQLMRAGIVVREVGRFDERRRTIKTAKLIKICTERQRREADAQPR